MYFYTSINNNYLAKARVLAHSVKQHCPDSHFILLLADTPLEGFCIENEPFDELLLVEQLELPTDNVNLWIYIHTVVELCTAIKGQALVQLLERGYEKVVYLDPDIVVFDDLKELDRLLDQHDVVLTPHQIIQEQTDDDVRNNEICSLKHGIYNYGFYAVRNSPNGLKYARWWRDRLMKHCYDDIPNGLFTDQRWGDLTPALFEGVYIWRDPGCNVSTWNITTREVTQTAQGGYLVNGLPLKFYHFSGFDSGAQKIMLEVNGNRNPCLFDLREWYSQLQDEQGQQQVFHIPSVYNFYSNGEKISKEERLLMRKRQDLLDFFGQTNPFIVEQQQSYYFWYRTEMQRIASEENEAIREKEQQLLEPYQIQLEESKRLLAEVETRLEQKQLELDARLEQKQLELDAIYQSNKWKMLCRLSQMKKNILRRS